MRLQDLDLNLLVVLDALLTEQGVTRAAQRLHLTQPALSNALRRLREHFGDELLVPLGRRMVLTPLAENLQQPIRETLLQLEGMLLARPSFEPSIVERNLTIVASDYVVTVLLNPFLRRIAHDAPGLSVEIVAPTRPMLDRFALGELDLCIVPEDLAHPVHPTALLFRDHYCSVVWVDNPLVGDSLSVDMLADLRHLITGFGDSSVHVPRDVLQRSGLKHRTAVVMPSFGLALEAVVGTHHATTVPRMLAERYAERLPLKLLRCPVELPPIVEVLQWHKHRDRDPLVRWLRTELLQGAPG